MPSEQIEQTQAIPSHATPLPLIHKASVMDLQVDIVQAGLCLGDEVEARSLDDGTIGLFAEVKRRLLGILPLRRRRLIGRLGPKASALVQPEIDRGDRPRLRIVSLTPKFLAAPGGDAEVSVSVWVRA